MAGLSASWTRLVSNSRLQRSSQVLSVLSSKAWIFGGELLPRQPVDNRLDVVDLAQGPAEGKPSKTLQRCTMHNARAQNIVLLTSVIG